MEILFIIASYFIGSIPTGVLIAKIHNVNLREVGSGNIGATNVLRAMGKKEAILTLLGDSLKGFLPVFIAGKVGFGENIIALCGVSAFFGHLFPVFLKFKGGKGVATSLGVFLGMIPVAAVLGLATWGVTAAIFRYSSLSALVAAVSMPLWSSLFYPNDIVYTLSAFLIGVFIFMTHRENIRRLSEGIEGKIGEKPKNQGGEA